MRNKLVSFSFLTVRSTRATIRVSSWEASCFVCWAGSDTGERVVLLRAGPPHFVLGRALECEWSNPTKVPPVLLLSLSSPHSPRLCSPSHRMFPFTSDFNLSVELLGGLLAREMAGEDGGVSVRLLSWSFFQIHFLHSRVCSSVFVCFEVFDH